MMKTKSIAFVSLILLLNACTPSGNFVGNAPTEAPGAAAPDLAIPGEFMVKGDKGAVEAELKSMGVTYTLQTYSNDLNLHHVSYKGSMPYGKIASRLAGQVEMIEQNSKVSLVAVEKKSEWNTDKYFFYQWALNNIGQSAPWGLPGKYDADTKVLQALKQYKGALQEDTIVAVIDSGVNYNHKDINANMWVNEAEAEKNGGVSSEDEDKNGFYNDIYGYDFTGSNRSEPHYGQMGDSDPIDEDGHGSHCAGVIAAISDNGIGVAGVNPRAKIMALRALAAGGGSMYDIQRAILYAIDKKANIISASFGGKGKSDIMKDIIDQAGKANILFVAAAGNDGVNMEIEQDRSYPAGYQNDNLLTVGASDNMDNPAGFSNYGSNYVDIYAPGVGILSLFKGGAEISQSDTYMIMDGTSMAAPLVSGIASLLMSAYPELKKNPVRVKEILMATVDKTPSMYGKVRSNGRINALAALEKAQSAVTVAPIAWQSESVSESQKGFNTELVDIRKSIVRKGAKAMRLHFDFIEVDRSFDSIYVYDKDYRLVTEIANGSSRDLWTPVVLGDTAIVRFVNAKVKEEAMEISMEMQNTDQAKCQKEGGTVGGLVPAQDLFTPVTSFYCTKQNMEYRYEDLKKDADDSDVFFSWKSEGYSIDKIEFTETNI